MPRWHFSWRYWGRCKWWKKLKECKKSWRKRTECLDDTSPEYKEEDVSNKKNDKSENNDKEKELGCLDDTSPE